MDQNSFSLLIGIYYMVFGLVIGSFLNVYIYRVPKKISVIKGYSYCPNCKTRLKAKDLFPLFSWIFLKGKCRYCKEKINVRYPIVESLTGLAYLMSFLFFGLTLKSIIMIIFFSVLIVLSYIDLDVKMVPDHLNLVIFILGIVSIFLTNELSIPDRIIGFFAVSLPLLLVVILTKGNGMGMGDVKLFAVCGLLIGWKLIFISLLFSSVLASIYGMIILKMNKSENHQLPFVPFISLGLFLSVLFGNDLISWYLKLFAL